MLKSLVYKELCYLWRDRGLRNILLMGPLLGLVLFFAIYSTQILMDIPTAVVDLDRSAASRELVQKLNQAENLNIAAYPDSYQAAEEMIKRGQVLVAAVIPEHYGKNLALKKQTNIFVAIDGSNMIYSTNATAAVLTVSRTISAEAGVKALIAKGITPQQAKEAFLGVDIREEAWFNPTLNYAYFMVLALILNVWQQCCTLAAATNIIGETGRPSWLQFKLSGISKWRLFGTKSLVQIGVFMLLVLPIYIISFGIFKVPLQGSGALFLLFTLVFAVSLHSVGTLASSFSDNAVDACRSAMVIALPSFILSGYAWPLEAMPSFLQTAVKILPQTWFFQGVNYFTFKNPGWPLMQHYLLALGTIALVCYSAAALITSRK